MLSSEDINFYKKNGFLIVKNILKIEEIERCLFDVNEIFLLQLNHKNINGKLFDGYESLFSNMISVFDLDQKSYISTAKLAAKITSFQRLSLSLDLENIIKNTGIFNPIKSTDAIFHIMYENLRMEGGYLGFSPHQDWTSMQGSLNSISIWAPFTPISESSFPVEIIPKSHRLGLLDSLCDNYSKDHLSEKMNGSETEINKNLYNESDFIPVIIQPGDIVLMSSWLIHRTKTSNCNLPRISMSTRFEDPSDPTWIKRYYPSAYTRVVRRDLITKNFPTKEEIMRYFNE